MKTHLDKALNYVRGNIDIDYLKGCITTAMQMRMPLGCVAPLLVDNIYDLLEEYGQDNDLPEGWWCEYGDIDDIVEQIQHYNYDTQRFNAIGLAISQG